MFTVNSSEEEIALRRLLQEMDAGVWWPAVVMPRLIQVDTLFNVKGYSCSCERAGDDAWNCGHHLCYSLVACSGHAKTVSSGYSVHCQRILMQLLK